MLDLWFGIIDISNAKHLKRKSDGELLPVLWHPTRVWDLPMSEDDRKEIEPF